MGDQGSARWECELCGEQHEGLATVFGAHAPDPWIQAAPAEREDGELTPDVCVLKIDGEWHYFMRGHIEIPLTDLPGDRFAWSAWVSLSETSMKLAVDHWDDPERGNLAPMFGWLCNELPYEKSTLSIPTHVHQREPGMTPLIQLDPSVRHPLVMEQATGIGMHRLAEINRAVLG
jgi:hypothetical protein